MKHRSFIFIAIFFKLLGLDSNCIAQETVTDFDGNIYHTVVIGEQVWLQENLKSLHFSDGSTIPDVVSYDESETNANIYGRLYNWDAAMGSVNSEGAQGICPDGWHIPSDAEWSTLEDYLGGAGVAGGKMKESGTDHWRRFNIGADNSSGFTALPGGEYDAHDSPNQFRLLNDYAVFWTSTEVSNEMANERYLGYNSASSTSYNWYKSMKYSIRAIRDSNTSSLMDIEQPPPNAFCLFANYPNPFNPETIISYELQQAGNVLIQIYDIQGSWVNTLVNARVSEGVHQLMWNGVNSNGTRLHSGLYVVILSIGNNIQTQKVSLIR